MTEIAANGERVTAVLTSHTEGGENYDGAILIGIYPGANSEIWVELHGARANIQCSDIDALCKQLKRAKKIAQEQEE